MYFLDTNTISYLLEGNTAVLQEYLLARETDVIRVPDIVYYEVYRGLLYRDSRKLMKAFTAFSEELGIVSISRSDFEKAAVIYAELRKSGMTIDDDDILIAAMAVNHDAILVTHNTRHFSTIKDLRIETWVTT